MPISSYLFHLNLFSCSEFNYRRDTEGKCVLTEGATPLPSDESCPADEEYWYERTAYRKIPYSSCKDGERIHQGTAHRCPGLKGHSGFFWLFVLVIPFLFASLIGYYYYRKSGMARGYVSYVVFHTLLIDLSLRTIRLPGGDPSPLYSRETGVLDTLASVPWFLIGLAGIAWEWVASRVDTMSDGFRSRRGYRNLPVDEDAQILRFEDEE